MKRYVRLKCSVCDRVKDQLLDTGRYVPDQCTITYQCEGRLSPVDYVSNGSSILGVPPVGVTNWYRRGTAFSTIADQQAAVLLDTSTGSLKQLVVAVPYVGSTSPYPDTAVLKLTLGYENQNTQSFLQYTFKRFSPFTVLNGLEDGTAKKVLRYNIIGGAPDSVSVFVNGVKRERGLGPTEYQLYDGAVGSACPPNSILFNSSVIGNSNQIDVVVTKAVEASETTMVFTKMVDDESRRGVGAWEGVKKVKLFQGQWINHDLFYLDFSEYVSPPTQPLPRDVKLAVRRVEVITDVTSAVSPSVVKLLLSREKMHLQIDRLKSSVVVLSALDGESNYLMCKYIDDVRTLLFTKDAATSVFPPMNIEKYSPEVLLKTGLSGNADATQLDSDLIIGPDS